MISEAVRKLKYADYLISSGNLLYMNTAVKHILISANTAINEYLQLDGKISPILARQKLAKGSEFEQEFAVTYMELLRMTQRAITKEEAVKIYKQVKTFVEWVRDKRLEDDSQI